MADNPAELLMSSRPVFACHQNKPGQASGLELLVKPQGASIPRLVIRDDEFRQQISPEQLALMLDEFKKQDALRQTSPREYARPKLKPGTSSTSSWILYPNEDKQGNRQKLMQGQYDALLKTRLESLTLEFQDQQNHLGTAANAAMWTPVAASAAVGTAKLLGFTVAASGAKIALIGVAVPGGVVVVGLAVAVGVGTYAALKASDDTQLRTESSHQANRDGNDSIATLKFHSVVDTWSGASANSLVLAPKEESGLRQVTLQGTKGGKLDASFFWDTEENFKELCRKASHPQNIEPIAITVNGDLGFDVANSKATIKSAQDLLIQLMVADQMQDSDSRQASEAANFAAMHISTLALSTTDKVDQFRLNPNLPHLTKAYEEALASSKNISPEARKALKDAIDFTHKMMQVSTIEQIRDSVLPEGQKLLEEEQACNKANKLLTSSLSKLQTHFIKNFTGEELEQSFPIENMKDQVFKGNQLEYDAWQNSFHSIVELCKKNNIKIPFQYTQDSKSKRFIPNVEQNLVVGDYIKFFDQLKEVVTQHQQKQEKLNIGELEETVNQKVNQQKELIHKAIYPRGRDEAPIGGMTKAEADKLILQILGVLLPNSNQT